MGVYHGANSDCYNCKGCGTNRACDDCSADCCQNNMSSHRELRRLEDSFREEVNQFRKNVCNNCVSIINELRKDYNIMISYDEKNDYLEQSSHIIEKLETRKDFIKSKADSIKEDYFVKKRLNDLKDEHNDIMKNIRKKFSDKEKKLKDESENMKMLNKEIERKENEKNNLSNEKNEIKKKAKNRKEAFKEEKEKIFRAKLINEKKEIDSKYSYLGHISYPIKEYSQQEKDYKNALLNNIRRIKNYSIPESIMNNFGLINYLY